MLNSILILLVFAEGSPSYGGPRHVPDFEYHGTVWPQPQLFRQELTYSILSPFISFNYISDSKQCELLQDTFNRYGQLIRSLIGQKTRDKKLRFSTTNQIDQIDIEVINCEDWPSESMNEAYTIEVDQSKASILAESEFGVMRALETFAQLIHPIKNAAAINTTYISDFPRFAYRGLLIDTSRHFLPVEILKSTISAMAWNKLNVFHWHIVDLESFPYQSTSLPLLSHLGAYTEFNHVYSPYDVQDVINYARNRGIRVIPEFDTPGHTASWGPGAGPGFLTQCYDANGDPIADDFGPIDPTRGQNYNLVKTLFTELSGVFRDSYIHLGGDEVPFGCWKSNPDITAYMKKHNITTYADLESLWVTGVIEIAQDLNLNYVVWEEVFTNGVKVNNETVIEVWKNYGGHRWNETIANVTKAGYNAILSAPWYLNYIEFGVDWTERYLVEPLNFTGTAEQKEKVIGGSAAMWGEYVDATNILPRTWPSASAVAERLWSAEEVNNTDTAMPRLVEWRCRMLSRGLPAEPNLLNPNRGDNANYSFCPEPYDPSAKITV